MTVFRTSNRESYKASVDLTDGQYLFLKRGAERQEAASAGAGEETIGVQMSVPESATAGEGVDVAMPGGGAKLKVSASALVGNTHLKSDANGLGVAASSGDFVGAILDIGTNELTVSGNTYPVIVTAFYKA